MNKEEKKKYKEWKKFQKLNRKLIKTNPEQAFKNLLFGYLKSKLNNLEKEDSNNE